MDRIADWIAQVQPASPTALNTVKTHDRDSNSLPRPRKQQRRSLDHSDSSGETEFRYAFNMAAPQQHTVPVPPVSPSPTGNATVLSTPSKTAAKRAADDEVLDTVPDLEQTPRPARSQQSPKRRRPSKSPEKKTGKRSAHTLLTRLEKPCFEGTTRPKDVPELQSLDKRLRQIERSVRVIPSCIRDVVEHVLDDVFDETQFYLSDDQLKSEAELQRLLTIVDESDRSDSKQRNEDAWNNLVHTPILELAFPPANNGPELQRLLQRLNRIVPSRNRPASVRYEPMMSATIIFDAVPRLQLPYANKDDDDDADAESVLACSVTSGRSGLRSITTNESIDETYSHTRASSKKVDYCLAMDLVTGDPLERVLWELTQSELSESPHVDLHTSQTTYRVVQENLLPVAIETKQNQASTDPFEQLGIWTAAFHRRMHRLRMSRRLAMLNNQGQPVRDSGRELVVPLPLITVRGSNWSIMYALDRGDRIEITKASAMGSTSSVLNIYRLLASLRALGEWIETGFYEGMREWFSV
ncbi:hypothetical protein LIA77_11992 [Sarocladium implicatum]|nr:hypothetical protein LIA77_11992 [Sarocladium implicatum]